MFISDENIILWDELIRAIEKENLLKKYRHISIETLEKDSLRTASYRNNQEWINATIAALEGRSVQELHLFRTCTDSIPAGIARIKGIEGLSFEKNRLAALPYEIGELKKLNYLMLGRNSMSALPKSIGAMKKLEVLYIEENEGLELPDEIAQLKLLIIFDKNNCGEFPKQLLKMPQLKYVSLSDNNMATIPEGIGQLRRLQELELENNQLTSLPTGLQNLKKLKSLVVSNNE